MAKKRSKLVERLLDTALPAAVLILVILVGYMLFVGPRRHERPKQPEKAAASKPATAKKKPSAAVPPPIKPVIKARVAFVIDDLGSDMAALERILDIDAPIAVAVLPGLAYSKKSADKASGAGREVLLHLPMQPQGESMKGLGPGALTVGMDPSVLRTTVEDDLSSVPGAVGVNNHMGSCLTEDRISMGEVMEILGSHRLFFLDSRTSPASVAVEQAREHSVPTASRNVFLDDSNDEAAIRQQFGRLVRLSLTHGEAIAIGHPRPATIKVLNEEIPKLKSKGIEVVRVSRLMR